MNDRLSGHFQTMQIYVTYVTKHKRVSVCAEINCNFTWTSNGM